jgi:F0F1-type ATP synthase membrane subunit c/vacuolar-type H+-ATPase subunit K
MTTSTTAVTDNQARAAALPTVASTAIASTAIASTAIESADRSQSASRREAVLVTALVALVAAVALFGLAFPGLLAPAVAIAILAAIVALEWLLPSGELRQASARFWKH